jgi:hypothetical protein
MSRWLPLFSGFAVRRREKLLREWVRIEEDDWTGLRRTQQGATKPEQSNGEKDSYSLRPVARSQAA